MTKLIHKSPLGPLTIAGVLGEIEPGEPFDAPDDIAASLLEQSELYELAPAARRSRPPQDTAPPSEGDDTAAAAADTEGNDQ